MFYGPFILKDAGLGVSGTRELLINTLPLSTASFIGALCAIFFMDQQGRRAMMLVNLPIIGVAMVLLSGSMYMISKSIEFGSLVCLLALFLFVFFF